MHSQALLLGRYWDHSIPFSCENIISGRLWNMDDTHYDWFFSPILCFDVETLLKEYPFLIGKKEIENAGKLESGVLGSIVIASSFIIFLAIILPVIIPYHLSGVLIVHIRIMMASAGIALFSAFLYHRFAAHQNFKIVAFLDSFRSTLILLILVSFSLFWGVKGRL
jgi:hypothetical protein